MTLHPIAATVYDSAIRLRRTSTKEIERGPDGIQRIHEVALERPDVLNAAAYAALDDVRWEGMDLLSRVQVIDAASQWLRARSLHEAGDRRDAFLAEAARLERERDRLVAAS